MDIINVAYDRGEIGMWKDKTHKRMKFDKMEDSIKKDKVICLVK